MFLKKRTERRKYIKNVNKAIILCALLVFAMITFSSCAPTKGSIVILENGKGTGFTMEFKKWSNDSKCDLSLVEGDVVQIEVISENGEINLMLKGASGSEPYEGKNLETGIFTVKVSETDEYMMKITGKDATGKVIVKNLGGQ